VYSLFIVNPKLSIVNRKSKIVIPPFGKEKTAGHARLRFDVTKDLSA
jgi:hypothetical protein